MGTRKTAVGRGGISDRVAANVKAIRERRHLSLRALSDELTELGRPILASGLTKLEQGERGIDVDDLMALAAALNVTPNALLLPEPVDDAPPFDVTPNVTVPAQHAWGWAQDFHPLYPEGDPRFEQAWVDFHDRQPTERAVVDSGTHPALLAVYRLGRQVRRIVAGHATPQGWRRTRQELDRVVFEVDQLEKEVTDGQRHATS